MPVQIAKLLLFGVMLLLPMRAWTCGGWYLGAWTSDNLYEIYVHAYAYTEGDQGGYDPVLAEVAVKNPDWTRSTFSSGVWATDLSQAYAALPAHLETGLFYANSWHYLNQSGYVIQIGADEKTKTVDPWIQLTSVTPNSPNTTIVSQEGLRPFFATIRTSVGCSGPTGVQGAFAPLPEMHNGHLAIFSESAGPGPVHSSITHTAHVPEGGRTFTFTLTTKQRNASAYHGQTFTVFSAIYAHPTVCAFRQTPGSADLIPVKIVPPAP